MSTLPWHIAALKPGRVNVLGFCKLVGEVVNAYNKLYLDDKNKIEYYPAYPEHVREESDQSPVDQRYIITYDIYRREDGTIGPDPFGGKKERAFKLMSMEPASSGGVREKWMKRYDNMVRFDCFAPTTTEANELIDVFERMMELHRSYFLGIGLDQMTYEGRLAPIVFQRSNYRSKASLWYVRDQLVLYKDQEAIRQIEQTVNDTFTNIIGESTNSQEE